MGYNLPEGNNHYLDDCDMICQECERKDDVDNGEYYNHRWYCKDCYDRLFKECPKCHISIISTDEEMCEDCLAEKTYDESAEGMFEKLGYIKKEHKSIIKETVKSNIVQFSKEEDNFNVVFEFDLLTKTHVIIKSINSYRLAKYINTEELKAVIQFYKELGWL